MNIPKYLKFSKYKQEGMQPQSKELLLTKQMSKSENSGHR